MSESDCLSNCVDKLITKLDQTSNENLGSIFKFDNSGISTIKHQNPLSSV